MPHQPARLPAGAQSQAQLLANGESRVTCAAPRCRQKRLRRGHAGGRFLLTVRWISDGAAPAGALEIRVPCRDCGTQHVLLWPIPAQDRET